MNNEDQWPRCAKHPHCQYQYISLTNQVNKERLLCPECFYSEHYSKQKSEIIESIPLSIALRSPGILIDQIKNDFNSKQLKDLFKFCECNMDNQFNEYIKKIELLILFIQQIKDQIKQQLSEYKETQEQVRRIRDQFNEKCRFKELNWLISQLKSFDNGDKSNYYFEILSQVNTTLDDLMKDNHAFITLNTDDAIRDLRFLKSNQNDQLLSNYNQLFQQFAALFDSLNYNITSYQLTLFNLIFQLLYSFGSFKGSIIIINQQILSLDYFRFNIYLLQSKQTQKAFQ